MEKEKNIKPSARVMNVTPDQAQLWLLKNETNRRLDENWVLFYLAEMRKGSFKVQNDAISFDYDGKLINGQHRLTAVVRFRKPVEMLVMFGLHPDTFKIIDTNLKKRSTGDALSSMKITNAHAKAAIAKFYMEFRKGHFNDRGGMGRIQLGNSEVCDFVERHDKKLTEILAFTMKVSKNMSKAIQPRYLGALIWLLSDISQDAADTFFTLYGTGLDLTEKHPVYILRKKLIEDLQSIKKYRTSDKIAWTIIAWNFFRQSKQISKIQWNPDKQDFPKPI